MADLNEELKQDLEDFNEIADNVSSDVLLAATVYMGLSRLARALEKGGASATLLDKIAMHVKDLDYTMSRHK